MVAEFVLVMQFMWKYIDEFAGKGFSTFDFVQLIFYYSIALIPMAVPITILISSVMVYGNLSEKYEQSSMKSAGISLLRIMSPGLFIAILTFFFSLSVSNYFRPKAQYQFLKLFNEIRKKKPTLNIQEKIFNKDFHGYAIQVDKKHKNGEDLEDIKLYDVLDRSNEKYNITTAKKGRIFTTKDGDYFIMKLFDGYQYIEKKKRNTSKKSNKTYPLMRTHFDTLTKVFDMSEFNKKGSSHFFSKRKDLLNSLQLMTEIDSVANKIKRKKRRLQPKFQYIFNDNSNESKQYITKNNISHENKIINETKKIKAITHYSIKKIKGNTKKKKKAKKKKNYCKQIDTLNIAGLNSFIESFGEKDKENLIYSTSETIDYDKNNLSSIVSSIKSYQRRKDYWVLALHQQYSWALVCIVFLFIGAPLGSIIRKGGYGYPVLVAILFFTFFILLSISGDKFNKNMMFNPIFNAWIPVIVLLPISIFVTFKALTGAKILDINNLKQNLITFYKKRGASEEVN